MPVFQQQTNGERDRLSATIHLLGDILGRVIREQAGANAFALEERVRGLAKDLRANNHPYQVEAMQRIVAGLTVGQARDLLKSFSTYFALVNLSEQLQRIWVLRDRALERPGEPRAESIAAAVAEEAERQIAEEIVGLWQSDEVRVIRPTVVDEVKNGLYYFEATLVDLIPRLYRDLERELRRHYPEHEWRVPPLLRFGSWMGGDRDGNPYVTPEVTIETVRQIGRA